MPKIFFLILASLMLLATETNAQTAKQEVDTIPMFPSCKPRSMEKNLKCFQRQMEKHIANHFKYPRQAELNEIEGVVKVMATINEEGDVTDIKTSGPHPLLEAEAVRIIQLLPRFRPAVLDGIPVAVPYSIPLTFRLEKSKLDSRRIGDPRSPDDEIGKNPSLPVKYY